VSRPPSRPPGRSLLVQAKDLVTKCDRCGTCLPVCPLFRVLDLERASARGRNTIARGLAEGCLAPDRQARAAVEFCLLCRACTDTCPNHVPTDEAMMRVRQFFADEAGGPSSRYRLIGGLLRSRRLLRLGASALGLTRRLRLGTWVPGRLLPREFPRDQYLAASAGPAVLAGSIPAPGVLPTPGCRVAYFQGCGMRLLFPDASRSTLNLLNRYSRVAVKGNGCCGLPHLAHGMGDTFLELARSHIELYADADIVVTDCASCGGALKHLASHFEADLRWQGPAAAFSAKVMDLTEYLVRMGYRGQGKRDITFTYHDPCHLARGQGIRSQPRQLLESVGHFVDMKEPDTCCGGAGTFHLDHPGAASQILACKRDNIECTGAGIVVTACPGCLIQLTRAAEASGGKFKAMHISQVI